MVKEKIHHIVTLFVTVAIITMAHATFAQTIWTALPSGGSDNLGTIGYYDEATQDWTVEHHFTTPFPGAYPTGGELTEANGKFYGMTPSGGKNNMGVLFEWDPATNAYTSLYAFGNANGTNGMKSNTSVIFYNGKLFGTCSEGGTQNGGVIFEFDLSTKTFVKKVDLSFWTGSRPYGKMQLYDGKFYAATSSGGAQNRGAIFQWDPTTNFIIKKIDLDAVKGSEAKASMTLYNGIFYGLTTRGGINNTGVIFSWDPTTNVYTRRNSFNVSVSESTQQLALSNGKLYGIHRQGQLGTATVFEWEPTTSTFTKTITPGCINDVCIPTGDVAVLNGKVYGYLFTDQGGIFEWDPSTNTFLLKLNFNTKGVTSPVGKLALKNGKFYGLTGGASTAGNIFEWNPTTNGFKTKITFDAAINGKTPNGPLTLAQGKFYGTTSEGGTSNKGILFEWDPIKKVFKKLYDLSTAQGSSPRGALTYYDGKLYGTTQSGGSKHDGVIFSYDLATNVYSKTDFDCGPTGCQAATLALRDGKFYGSTYAGGSKNKGTIFSFDPQTSIIQKRIDLTEATGASGISRLTYHEGKFYGAAHQGGANGQGAIFEWNPTTNAYTYRHDFSLETGGQPAGPLTFFDGKFYGTTSNHVLYSWDHVTNVFTIELNLIHNLTGTGASTTLVASNGRLYGTAFAGGAYFGGTLFWYDPAMNAYGNSYSFNDNSGRSPQATELLILPKTPNVYITSPNDGSVEQKIKLNVVSKFAPGVTTYTIEVSPTNDFSEDVKTNSGGQTLAFDSLDYNTTYFARVKTNLTPFYGKTTTFKTVSPSYYAFVKGPSNNKVDVPLNQTIVLNTVLRATQYTVELNTNASFNPATALTLSGLGTVYHFAPFQPNTTYYSRVKTNLENAWGETRTFTTRSSASAKEDVNTLSYEEEVDETSVEAYPNPFRDNFSIVVRTPQNENVEIDLVDLTGRRIHRATMQSNTATQISHVKSNGVYILKIQTATHLKTIKIIKE